MADVVRRYYLPRIKDADGRELDSWSVWLVDEATGTLVIFGDRGTWSYTWGHSGRSPLGKLDFRYELIRVCGSSYDGYLFEKLSSGVARVFDANGTRERVRRTVCRLRREGTLGHDAAREDWDDASSIDGEIAFATFLDTSDRWETYGDAATYVVHEHGWLEHLMTVTRPRFVVAVRDELNREFRAAAKRGLRDRGDDFWAAARGYARALEGAPSWMAAGVVEPKERHV